MLSSFEKQKITKRLKFYADVTEKFSGNDCSAEEIFLEKTVPLLNISYKLFPKSIMKLSEIFEAFKNSCELRQLFTTREAEIVKVRP